ncbi:phytoene desaturase family protein [Sulfurisphaera ohwakuensis]|uniref:FAD-dependent oxidoreductase n=1 Tax=Sulfurisphaera ohwakuensis TaxID=69656 RepID=A0A650CG17_SULOH|nr:NAD(P)/FAD-dependent oxidoreductase [Sulfurisphaera ohwakuensis]MBB5254984.1 phytoene dehydrogenase-like protein [Sulfurisphaera ohwakuensis]QGR16625.1 FAD-dependent oxidoreductase [Sulfurisphaera ohwakuensis]
MNYDVIVIGAGHNGLVSANYLAKHGLKVLVIEARNKPGGMADTAEYKGLKYSRASYVLGLFPKRIEEELGISFPVVDSPFADIFLTEDGEVLYLWRDEKKRIEEFIKHGEYKYEKLDRLIFKLKRIVEEKFLFVAKPPSIEDFKKVVENTELEIFLEPTRKVLSEYLDSKFHGALAYAFMFNLPAYIMAYYFSLDWRIVKGGMGIVGKVLEENAKKLGVDFMYNTRVEKIIIKNGKAEGVITNDGKVIQSKVVLHAGSPVLLSKLTDNMIKVYHPNFIPGWRRWSLLLKEAPKVPEFMKDHLDSLFTLPFGEVTIPSAVDPSLGCHVITSMGGDIEEIKDFFKIKEENVIYIDLLTADKLEKEYFAPFGDMNHMPMTPEYMFDNRPVKGWGYTTPIKNLYITGSGTYPGGQVTGIPGRNAAMKILEDLIRENT